MRNADPKEDVTLGRSESAEPSRSQWPTAHPSLWLCCTGKAALAMCSAQPWRGGAGGGWAATPICSLRAPSLSFALFSSWAPLLLGAMYTMGPLAPDKFDPGRHQICRVTAGTCVSIFL